MTFLVEMLRLQWQSVKKGTPNGVSFFIIQYIYFFSTSNWLKFTCSRLKDFSLKGGDPAAPSDTATLLWLHPSHWFYLRRLLPIARLAHRLWVPPTPMAWQAVCTRPGNAFTPTCWFGITSNSGFVWAGCSPQSELRLGFWGSLHLAVSHLFVPAIVARF